MCLFFFDDASYYGCHENDVTDAGAEVPLSFPNSNVVEYLFWFQRGMHLHISVRALMSLAYREGSRARQIKKPQLYIAAINARYPENQLHSNVLVHRKVMRLN